MTVMVHEVLSAALFVVQVLVIAFAVVIAGIAIARSAVQFYFEAKAKYVAGVIRDAASAGPDCSQFLGRM